MRDAVEFRVLGALEVRRAGAPVEIRSERQRTLLAALLVNASRVVSVDALTEALWECAPPADPRNAIQTYVARLREGLGADVALVTRSPGYALEVEPGQVDALRFEQLVAEAHERRDEPAAVHALLDEALALWRGPAYAEFANGVARPTALRLEERRLVALEERAAAGLRLGRAGDLVGDLEALAAEHPLRERVHELHMRALAAADRQHDALAAYRSYRERLADEAGLEPSQRLRDLEGRILRGELTASPPAAEPDPDPGTVIDVGARPPATAGRDAATSPDAETVVGGIPLPPTSLVGREADVAEVQDALERHRVVTLTGTGGVGKTRIAAAVALTARDVAWAELAPVADPAAVEHVIAAALGVDLTGGSSAQDVLLGALGARDVLLVLDNCEHLLDAVAPLIDGMQRRCPGVRVLATSRERLAIDGEAVRHVAPLAAEPGDGGDPPAVQLFLERAAAVTGDVDLTDGQRAAIVAICQRLDGLPLAIELAAARTGVLTPEELLAALDDDVAHAVGARRSRPERHRDLWSVVDWSYRLLAPDEQCLFERLGVFAGTFGVAEAHAVCGSDGQPVAATREQLAVLTERSLLSHVAGNGGYRMLRPLRAFARQRLADRGQLDELVGRHAKILTTLAEHAAGPPLTAAGARWLSTALDDLRAIRKHARLTGDAALLGRLVAALLRFDYWRPGTELLGWADDVLAIPGHDALPTAPQVHAAAAAAAWMRGNLERASRLAERAVELSSRADSAVQVYAYEALADTAFFAGRIADGEAAFREVVRLAQASDDPDGEVNGRVGVALLLAYTGRFEEAVAEADAANRITGRSGPAVRAFARYAQGECRAEVAPDEAVHYTEAAAELARACDAWFIEGVALLTAASLRGRHGDPVQAVPAFVDLLRHWRRSGNWTQQWTTLRNVAELLARLGAHEPAVSIAAATDAEPTASPTFGPESDRLDRALATARSRLGAARYEAAVQQGQQLQGEAAVELALAALASLQAPTGGA